MTVRVNLAFSDLCHTVWELAILESSLSPKLDSARCEDKDWEPQIPQQDTLIVKSLGGKHLWLLMMINDF